MTKLIAITLCMAVATAAAQPAPDAPKKGTDEKAGKDETLQNGGSERPWASGVSDSEQKAALASFRDGNVSLNDGLFAKASEHYRAALQHWKHPAIHYNLALAQMNLDQPVEAYDNFKASLVFGAAPLQSQDKFDRAKDYLLLLEKEIADVEVSCDKPGAKVSVDGKPVFTAPGNFKTRVRVGRHTFVAEKAGYTTRINAPYVGAGEHFRIELKLYTADELTRYRRKWSATWMPYAVIGGGLAIGFAGGLFELSAQSSYREYDHKVATCNINNMGCANDGSLKSIRDSGDTKKTLGYVGYGVAAGAIVVGGVLAYLNRPESYQIRAEDLPGEKEDKISVAPIVTPSFAGGMVQGHF